MVKAILKLVRLQDLKRVGHAKAKWAKSCTKKKYVREVRGYLI